MSTEEKKILAGRSLTEKQKVSFSDRLKNALALLPKNYTIAIRVNYPMLKKHDIYNVVRGRCRNYKILESIEKVAELIEKNKSKKT